MLFKALIIQSLYNLSDDQCVGISDCPSGKF
ncbi:MAG: hypothetical protein KA114_09120 [Bacteroidales bacterium]|nr:hypothetical protein [Bacteroidales bacterium]